MNDYNIKALNDWLKHLKEGLVLAISGHIFTWILLIVLIILVIRK